MGPFLYRCLATGFLVQGHIPERDPKAEPGVEFEAITCIACGRLHFVNPETGALLGNEAE